MRNLHLHTGLTFLYFNSLFLLSELLLVQYLGLCIPLYVAKNLYDSSNSYICTPCASTLWIHIGILLLSISHVFLGHYFFYDFLHNFFIIYTINKLFFEPSIIFFLVTFSCFYTKSTYPLLRGLILFSVQFTIL